MASMPASGGQAKVRPKIAVKDSALRIKIISMGDGGTGKTAIIKRYCEEKVSGVVSPCLYFEIGVCFHQSEFLSDV
jgi:GTPase SAR1 family protein